MTLKMKDPVGKFHNFPLNDATSAINFEMNIFPKNLSSSFAKLNQGNEYLLLEQYVFH